jgi:ribosome-binding factor A
MARNRRPQAPSTHRYPRTARLNESLREVIAEELTKIDDERLDLVTITAIDVDSEMNRAIVFYDSLRGEEGDAEILEALNAHRVRIQSSIGRQVRAKKTPILSFRPDEVIRSAEHIEQVLQSSELLPSRPERDEADSPYVTPRVRHDDLDDEDDLDDDLDEDGETDDIEGDLDEDGETDDIEGDLDGSRG